MNKEMRDEFKALWSDECDEKRDAAHEGIAWALSYIRKHQEAADGVEIEEMTPAQLGAILFRSDPDFVRVIRKLPSQHWARYDLAAVRLGFEISKMTYQEKL